MTLTHLLIFAFSFGVSTFILVPFVASFGTPPVLAVPLVFLGGLELAWWICRIRGYPPLFALAGPCPACNRRAGEWRFRWESRLLLTLECGNCEQRVKLWMGRSVPSTLSFAVPTFVLRWPEFLGIWRRVHRLAGLLQVADQEFSALRKASLNAFAAANDLVAKIDGLLADMCEAEVVSDDPDFLEDDPERLAAVGIKTIAQLETALQDLHPIIVAFGKRWLSRWEEEQKIESLHSGISLLYLWYVLIARNGSLREIRQMIERHSVGPPKERDQLAQAILDLYRAAVEDLSGAGPRPSGSAV